jgi:hypothetical protein
MEVCAKMEAQNSRAISPEKERAEVFILKRSVREFISIVFGDAVTAYHEFGDFIRKPVATV